MWLHYESQKNWFNSELTVYSHSRYKRVSLRDGFSRCLPWSRVSGPVEERAGAPEQHLRAHRSAVEQDKSAQASTYKPERGMTVTRLPKPRASLNSSLCFLTLVLLNALTQRARFTDYTRGSGDEWQYEASAIKHACHLHNI